mmetsp:Transcript_23072/g.71934  ORF Transcript_23072/g.71934 Transcript_23072/m.71934 type:complete len:461 (+) Transcript_23072:252-1634(+)
MAGTESTSHEPAHAAAASAPPPPASASECAQPLVPRTLAEARVQKLPQGYAYAPADGSGVAHTKPILQPDATGKPVGAAGGREAGATASDTHLDTTNVAEAAAAAARLAAEKKAKGVAKKQRQDARATVLAKQRRDDLAQQLREVSGLVERLVGSVEALLADARARGLPFGPARKAAQGLTVEGERQRLEAAHARRLQDIIGKQCVTTVRNMMGHKWAWPFNTPVKAEELGLHDYFTIIKRPMDLGTVRKRAESGAHYGDPDDVAADVRLALGNAMTYNPPGSDVHVMAKAILERFEEKWRGMVWPKLVDEEALVRADAARSLQRLEEAAKCAEVEEVDRRLREQQRALEEAERRLVELKQRAVEACTAVPTYRKKRLGDALGRLPLDKLEGAVAIVAQRSPGLVAAAGEVEMELDLDTQDPLTLRQLEHYVRTCHGRKRPLLVGHAEEGRGAGKVPKCG